MIETKHLQDARTAETLFNVNSSVQGPMHLLSKYLGFRGDQWHHWIRILKKKPSGPSGKLTNKLWKMNDL